MGHRMRGFVAPKKTTTSQKNRAQTAASRVKIFGSRRRGSCKWCDGTLLSLQYLSPTMLRAEAVRNQVDFRGSKHHRDTAVGNILLWDSTGSAAGAYADMGTAAENTWPPLAWEYEL